MSAIEPVAVVPPRPTLTKAKRVKIFDAAGGMCHLCGLPIAFGEKWDAEHVQARERGGFDDIGALKPAHIDCHKPKTAEDKRVIAQTARTRANHIGAVVKEFPAIQGAALAKSERSAKRASKPSLPPRPLFTEQTR